MFSVVIFAFHKEDHWWKEYGNGREKNGRKENINRNGKQDDEIIEQGGFWKCNQDWQDTTKISMLTHKHF